MAPCRLSARTSLTGSGPRAAITEALKLRHLTRPQSLHERLDQVLKVTLPSSEAAALITPEPSLLTSPSGAFSGSSPGRPLRTRGAALCLQCLPLLARRPSALSPAASALRACCLTPSLRIPGGLDGARAVFQPPVARGPSLSSPQPGSPTPILAASSVPFSLPRRLPRGCVRTGTVDRFAAAPILLLADTAL